MKPGVDRAASGRARSRWRGLLLARALALLEAQRPLDDAAELAAAAREGHDLQQRVLARAWRLAEREGLVGALAGLQRHAAWLALAGLLLVLLSSGGMLQAVLGGGRRINVVFAFVSLLGAHAGLLLLWVLSLPWRAEGGGLGRWLWRLDGRWASPPQQALLAAGLELLAQRSLGRWLFGTISHGLWTLAFALVLLWLAIAFSLQAFELSWETTILQPAAFPAFVELTGRWPAWLGLPIAEPQALAAAAAAERHRLLAWWLLSCVLAWGLLPRALLGALCGTLAAWRARGLALDTTAPWVRRLATRFAALPGGTVIDAELAAMRAPPPPRSARLAGPLALVGFELPPEAAWPPAGAPAPALCQRIEGSGEEQQRLLQSLAQAGVGRVLLVVDGGASPDRGTGRFIGALQAEGRRGLALWLLAEPARLNERRWSAWLAEQGEPALPLFTRADQARDWATGTEPAA